MADFRKLNNIRNKYDQGRKSADEQLKKDYSDAWKKTDEQINDPWILDDVDNIVDRIKLKRKVNENNLDEIRGEIPRFHGQLDRTVAGEEPKEDIDSVAKKEALKKMSKGKK